MCEALRQFDQALREVGRAIFQEQTGFVGGCFARHLQAPPRPPNQRVPPKKSSDHLGQQVPKRITPRQVGQFVDQHCLALLRSEMV